MDSNAWNRAAQPQHRCFLLFRASRRPPKPMNDRPKGIKSRVQRAAGMERTPSIRPLRDAYCYSRAGYGSTESLPARLRGEFDSREHLVRAWGVRFGNIDEFETIDGVAESGEMNGSHRLDPSRRVKEQIDHSSDSRSGVDAAVDRQVRAVDE